MIQPPNYPATVPTAGDWQELTDACRQHDVAISGVSCYEAIADANGKDERLAKMKACMDLWRRPVL